MTRPQPTGGEQCPTCGPGYRYGDEGCRHEQPTGGAGDVETLTVDERALMRSAAEKDAADPLGNDGVEMCRAVERIMTKRMQAARDEERVRCEAVLDKAEAEIDSARLAEDNMHRRAAFIESANLVREARGGAR